MVNLEGTLSLGLIFWVVSFVNDITNVEFTRYWIQENELCFNGVITIHCAQSVPDGWKMYLKSSQRLSILTSTNATVHQSDINSSSFIFTNLPSNSQCLVGEILQLWFSGCTPHLGTSPRMTVEFHQNQKVCPDITPPKERQSIQVPTTLAHEDNSVIRVSLSIIIPVTVHGYWIIYLAVSTRLSKLNSAGVLISPTEGDTFKLANIHWNEVFIAGVTYILEVDGMKAIQGIREPCIVALFSWNKDMEVYPSTTKPLIPTANQTFSRMVQKTFELTKTEETHHTTTLSTELRIITTIQPSMSPTEGWQPKTIENWQPTATETLQPTTTENWQITTTETLQPRTTETWQPTTVSTTLPQSCAPYNYNDVLHKSILFYEAQRSGELPSNNRIAWRGDSALGDQGNNGEDLTGGWYDAGDYVKFGFPMAFSTTVLTWGLIEFPQSYTASEEKENMLNCIKWPLDYFIKAHVNQNEFYGQVGDGDIDHAYWGRPEDMTLSRPAFKIDSTNPGTDLAAETAAAMAAGSIVFAEQNQTYAKLLLEHAKTLYQFADNYRGKYSDSITDAAQFYASSGYNDELVWGAAWLYRATNDESYLEKAENYFASHGIDNPAWAFSWDEKIAGVQMLLFELTGKDVYKNALQSSLDPWLPGGSVVYTPRGLAWRLQWGSNRYAANTAFLALLASTKGLKSTEYREFAEKQIHYMLGDSGRSFVVGFGTNPPTRPHHASSSCPDRPASCGWDDFHSTAPNPQILYGALVGGPDQNDGYQDKRDDFTSNEVACDYNAGFQSAVAALKALDLASCSAVLASASKRSLSTLQSTSTLNRYGAIITSNNKISAPVTTRDITLSMVRITSTSISHSSTKSVEVIANTVSNTKPTPVEIIVSVTAMSSLAALNVTSTGVTITEDIRRFTLALSTTPQLLLPSSSLPEIKNPSPYPARTTSTERLQSITSFEATYSKDAMTRATNIQSLSTSHLQPSSTTTIEIGGTILSHECGDVNIPSDYYHLETTVRTVTEWPQGFTGQIIFTTTAQVRDGWRVEFVLNKTISLLNVHIVTAAANSGTRFTLHNKDYNKQLKKGQNVTIDFEATKENDNDNVPCMRAVFMWAVEEPCPTIESTSGSNSISANVQIQSQWNEGISGQITVLVPEAIRNGWQLRVLFDIPLTLTVFVAKSSPLTGTEFTLTNESYNSELLIGSTLVVDFTAIKQEIGETLLCADALFHW